jgi:predicted aldo/keto reductase-like oxidoreductase
MEKRILGKTGEQLSIIGFGGIAVSGVEQSEANVLVREAIDNGVNYFDVAPSYGNAQERLGPALEEFRKDVFLACKTVERDKVGAAAELRESLKMLRTDHFDLYQLHGMSSEDDLQKAMGPGGAIEAFVEAREQGLARYLGFSAHSAEVALALMDRFDFDTVLFPINWVCCFNANFGPQVIAKAKDKEMGRLAIKAMARTTREKGVRNEYPKCWYKPVTDPEETALAIRFTLSQPITAAVTPGDPRLLRRALDVGNKFQPLTDAEYEDLKRRAMGLEPIFKLES